MNTPQTIVIIGTGATAKGLAESMVNSRNRVLLCGHDFLDTRNFVEALQQAHPYYDIEALSCSYEASWEADIIILAISAPHQPEVAERIRKVANQKLVITIQDNAKELQQLLPHSRIVETFSNLNAAAFTLPSHDKKNVSCPVIAFNEEAAAAAVRIVTAAGFNPQVTINEIKNVPDYSVS